MEYYEETLGFDPRDLLAYLWKRLWMIAAALVIGAVVGLAVTVLFVDTVYTATTRMYVLSRASDSALSSSDYSLSNYIISDYKVLITGQNVTKEVIERLELDMTIGELSPKISVRAIENTRVLQIEVVDTVPQRAVDIANCVREVAGEQMQRIMNVEAVNLVYEAELPQQKSGPSISWNMALAGVISMMAAVGVLIVVYLLDDSLRTEEDVARYLGLSVLGMIPESEEMGKMAPKSLNGAARVGRMR